MANTTAIATSFKAELMLGYHVLGTGIRAADTIKAALYLTTATVNATTTAYSATNEVSGSGYTAGGVTVTNATAPTTSGTTAYWTPSAAIAFGTVTLATAFDTVLLYNSTQTNRAIACWNFGSTTVSAGTFTINMPVNAVGTALLQLA